TRRGHMTLRLADGVIAEMEDRSGQHGARMAIPYAIDQMVERAYAPRSDDRHGDRVGDPAGERDVETLARAIAVHGGEQDLAGAERDDLARIIHGVDAGGIAPAMGEDLPAWRLAFGR